MTRILYVAVPVALAATLLAGCSSDATDSALTLTVSRGNCGPTWNPPDVSPATFQLHNVGTVTTSVDLIDPSTGGIYAEVEALAPGTSRPMRVRLGQGAYAFRCYGEDTDAVTGPTVRLTKADPSAAPALPPVSTQEMVGAVEQYRTYVTQGLATLSTNVTTLAATLRTGEVGAARNDWLTAHLAYERLGAAYDTFGDFADQIDGLADATDPTGFAGLRRIEYGLWHGQSPASLVPVADQLDSDVDGLRSDFDNEQTDPNDLPLRAHEIMENAAQFELTGDADQGSGTGLATVSANLDGTQAVLDAIAAVIKPRYADWDQVTSWIGRTRALLDAQHRPDGSWTPVAALAPADRQRLNAAVGQLLEVLAPVAAIGEVRRTT